MEKSDSILGKRSNRRSFIKKSGMVAAGAATVSAGLLSGGLRAFAAEPQMGGGGRLSRGDIALLRMVAAAELVETDLWQQYAELGGVTTGAQNAYQLAFQNLDGDGSQYITSNTLDELTHAEFLNAYLESKGAPPVNLDKFRTLPSSKATGAQQIGRLTNLTQLSVDTSFFTRYRSQTNPDFGATFPQALPALAEGQFTAIPRNNADLANADHIQSIANTAAFHFAFIEGGGTSLYAHLSQKATSPEVLKILISIGGDEIAHFLEWVDFCGNGVQPPVAPLMDPTNGLTFPNFDAVPNPLLQTNLIFPIPCEFISPNLPKCAVIRPVTSEGITATAAINGFINDGLFIGQPKAFSEVLLSIAAEADAAQRLFF